MKKLTAREAYRVIRKWYAANLRLFEDVGLLERMGSKGRQFADLVNAMPFDASATDAEIKAILLEVSRGLLEVCFKGSDGNHMMGQYARAGLESFGAAYDSFSTEELEVLKGSRIGQHLTVVQWC